VDQAEPALGLREGQTFVGRSALIRHANFVKLPHTVFALPFALTGVTLASYKFPVSVLQVVWIVLAFTSARFAAMGFNRIADREIDARNPRTAAREIPSGAMSLREASVAVMLAGVLFFLSAAMLNRLCLTLAPVALGWVLFYSYTKRFTRWSHLALGIGLSIAPVGGYLAIAGVWSEPWWMLIALAVGVATWVGGFDILYALQDVSFDRSEGLHSVPAVSGETRALLLSRVLHAMTIAALAGVGIAANAGVLYAVGVFVAAALLIYEHSLVRANDFSKINAAFFTMNGVISIVFFAFVLTERLLK
jgi:4-hydroxybenzoate polyprenyltransferase